MNQPDGPFAKLAALKPILDRIEANDKARLRLPANPVRYSTADPEDIGRALHCIGLHTRDQISTFFGVHPDLVKDWLSGKRKLPLATAYTIALMAYHGDRPQTVEWLAGERDKPEG